MTPSIGSALAVTVSVEVPIVAWFYPRERTRMALTCAVATTVTNLAMNAGLRRVTASYDTYLLAGELAASALEALAYVVMSKRHPIGQALIASGVANAASFAAGLLLF
jgi:peptidoglycan biosynthesis protein MviN/MurJ (putative lipid II flippase)